MRRWLTSQSVVLTTLILAECARGAVGDGESAQLEIVTREWPSGLLRGTPLEVVDSTRSKVQPGDRIAAHYFGSIEILAVGPRHVWVAVQGLWCTAAPWVRGCDSVLVTSRGRRFGTQTDDGGYNYDVRAIPARLLSPIPPSGRLTINVIPRSKTMISLAEALAGSDLVVSARLAAARCVGYECSLTVIPAETWKADLLVPNRIVLADVGDVRKGFWYPNGASHGLPIGERTMFFLKHDDARQRWRLDHYFVLFSGDSLTFSPWGRGLRTDQLRSMVRDLLWRPQTTLVIGRLTDPDRRAIQGAAVEVEGFGSALSDARGDFRVPHVPIGEHTLLVRHAGRLLRGYFESTDERIDSLDVVLPLEK